MLDWLLWILVAIIAAIVLLSLAAYVGFLIFLYVVVERHLRKNYPHITRVTKADRSRNG